MLTFVLGFLAELAKETGSWLDRILPAPGVRRALRCWRRSRPFWAGLWAVAGGLELIALPLAPLPLMLKVGIGAMSAIGVGLVLIAGGLFFVFAPAQRMFVSVVTAIASLVSLATTNLGGFGSVAGSGCWARRWPSDGCRTGLRRARTAQTAWTARCPGQCPGRWTRTRKRLRARAPDRLRPAPPSP
ncbi:DUF6114 domain-containing protein [Streptomyces noursei]|uniref:DUF6114 domain-containing protein n=1 Tax=Streptomyces noursei TaxID=1971 RepID=UPI00038415C4|nr:DUF6114 domain-containing protein [Streptomyces noursei]EPY93099.1 hypothetical protein K530_49770 [Streptomyces noursei CCRC 11814]UWS75591.1 DUF6114 domain-containing protein [Streptomyces noursei]